MKKLYQWGFGGRMGSGRQFMPWIHIDDIAGIFIHAAENEKVPEILNGVAPDLLSNGKFAELLNRNLSETLPFKYSEWLLTLMLQKRAELLLKGHKIIPAATLASGYRYQFPTFESALRQLLGKDIRDWLLTNE